MSTWYCNKDLKPQGPFSFDDMKRKIMRGEVGPLELVLKDGERHWLPACEWSDFPKDLFPAFQKNLFRSVNPNEKEWTLLARKDGAASPVQGGPYSLLEIREFIRAKEATAEDYIWRTGLTGWLQIKDGPALLLAESSSLLSPSQTSTTTSSTRSSKDSLDL